MAFTNRMVASANIRYAINRSNDTKILKVSIRNNFKKIFHNPFTLSIAIPDAIPAGDEFLAIVDSDAIDSDGIDAIDVISLGFAIAFISVKPFIPVIPVKPFIGIAIIFLFYKYINKRNIYNIQQC